MPYFCSLRNVVLSVLFFLGQTCLASNCDNILEGQARFTLAYNLAAAAIERGFAEADSNVGFRNEMADLIAERARGNCAIAQCGPLKELTTMEIDAGGTITGFIPAIGLVSGKMVLRPEPFSSVMSWDYAKPGHSRLGNALWYAGHMISGFGPGYAVFLGSHETAAILALVTAMTGQAITQWSRKLERGRPIVITREEAKKREKAGLPVLKVPRKAGKEVANLAFDRISCHFPDAASKV